MYAAHVQRPAAFANIPGGVPLLPPRLGLLPLLLLPLLVVGTTEAVASAMLMARGYAAPGAALDPAPLPVPTSRDIDVSSKKPLQESGVVRSATPRSRPCLDLPMDSPGETPSSHAAAPRALLASCRDGLRTSAKKLQSESGPASITLLGLGPLPTAA